MQKEFGKQYIKDFNGTRSAIKAGYSRDSAAEIASENLRKPHIAKWINQLLAEKTLSAPETLKSISDIARSDLKDYFVVTKTTRRQKISISLAEYIERLEEEIDTQQYIHDIEASEGLLGEGEALDKNIAEHKRDQNRRKRQLVPHRVRLAKEPEARIIVDGPDELVEIADLDLARLVQDKDAGKIKSFSSTEHGPKVEMYAADSALALVGKHHKLFTEKIEHAGEGGGPIQHDVKHEVVFKKYGNGRKDD